MATGLEYPPKSQKRGTQGKARVRSSILGQSERHFYERDRHNVRKCACGILMWIVKEEIWAILWRLKED